MNPDLFDVVSDPKLHVGLDLSPLEEQLLGVIKHQMVIQEQFGQLTKHCELLYGRIAAIEKQIANKVLS